jgi:hypothetical protein
MSELLEIYNEFSRAFNTVDCFDKYYKENLINKSTSSWASELKKKLFKIHTFLKGRFSETEKPSTETVRIWIHKLQSLEEKAETIQYRITEDLLRCEAYEDIPEGYYPSEMVEDDLRNSGKSYKALYSIYKKQIKKEILRLTPLKPYADVGLRVMRFALNNMINIFKPIISDLVPQKKTNHVLDSGTKNSGYKASAKEKEVKSFEIPQNRSSYIEEIYEGLITAKPPLIKSSKDDFKLLFKGQVSSVKIDWLGAKNQLHKFIDKLIINEIVTIIGDQDHQWKITANYFTWHSKDFTSLNIKGSNRIKNKDKIKAIESLFS